jgi:hypothetical protein
MRSVVLGRSILRAAIPVDLLHQLDQEAARRGLTVEELVDRLLAEQLPALLAEATAEHLRRSLVRAHAAGDSGGSGVGSTSRQEGTGPAIAIAGPVGSSRSTRSPAAHSSREADRRDP